MARLIKLEVKNFKSIGGTTKNPISIDFDRNLTVFVGPNASGKSNILDALSFISDAVSFSLDEAFRRRFGVKAVRRETRHGNCDISFRIEIELSGKKKATYGFKIDMKKPLEFSVEEEECTIQDIEVLGSKIGYKIEHGNFISAPKGISPKLEKDRLALHSVSALSEYKELFDFLQRISVYNFSAPTMRLWQERTIETRLNRDGSNAATILGRLQKEKPESHKRLCKLLEEFIPSLNKVSKTTVSGQREILSFDQKVPQYNKPLRLYAHNMSDGTLRIFGILLALTEFDEKPFLVGIEEPELTVHPAMISKLIGYLIEESEKTQIIITTHSSEVLDSKIRTDQIRLVFLNDEMLTEVKTVDKKIRDLIDRKTLTAGELHKSGEL